MGKPIDLKECKTFCNERQVYPAMKHFVCELGMSVRAASREVRRKTNGLVSDSRAAHVYRNRTPAPFSAPDPPDTEKTKLIQKVNTEPDSVKPKPKSKPKIDKDKIFTESFKDAFEIFYKEVQNAKIKDWKKTSQEATYWHVDKIINLISIS